jgi:Reverse transcriptase (RNA-dependent DNA polymerase)
MLPVRLHDVYMSLLMYADDTAVLANSPQELQQLLDCIQQWCGEHGMTIHVDKTEIVVFNTTAQILSGFGATWSIDGKHVKVSQHFKYLGIHFHFSTGATYGLQKAAQRGRFAIACLHRKLHDLDVGANVELALHMYSSMVEPALLYGCEVWGQNCLQLTDPAASNNLEVEQVHRNFLRYVLKVRKNTPAWIVYREAGMYPVQHTCLKHMLQFLNRILQLDGQEYARIAMLECIADEALGGRQNWYSTLQSLLSHVSWGELIDSATIDVAIGRVEVDVCMTRWRDFYHRTVWHGMAADPRTAPTRRVTLCTYHVWFATDLPSGGSHWIVAPCITAPNVSYPHLINLIQLRTSNHKLAIQQLRQVYPIPPRAERTCPMCGSGAVQDECHMMFDCPALAQARLQYHSVFGQHACMKAAFTDPTITSPLASFIYHHVTPTN